MFHNEKMYKNFDDFIQNSVQANLVKQRVDLYYPDKIPENYTYLSDNTVNYDLDPLSKGFHYLFKYFWMQKQLEE